jgi:nicotinate-nucleotide--dimethylbenzimidazole phosphoribosyltransferase
MTLTECCSLISPPDAKMMALSRENWNRVAKPLGSLGKLEDLIVQIAGITRTAAPSLDRKAVVAFCADNGIVAEGVTQSGQEVSTLVAESMGRGTSSVCRMARVAGAAVIPVDIGLHTPANGPGVLDRSLRRGTANFAKEPAMTRAEAVQAIEVGISMVEYCQKAGYQLLATGEMGIGNTTTSSAVTAVLLHRRAAEVTGRGAGLSTTGLTHKIEVIDRAIDLHRPDPNDPLDVLSKVGGLDLAGLVGLYLGGAAYHIPVIMDGFIAAAAALVAVRLCPAVQSHLIASHWSEEPATVLILRELGLSPILHAGMHLGEGTGAVALMPLLDMALAVYQEASTFGNLQMDAYEALQ